MYKQIEDPEQIPKWITDRWKMLLPKAESLDDEKDYRSVTCLSTCYKISTGKVARSMKGDAGRNSI